MKVKSFIPFICSKNDEEIIKTFEALGFEKNHVKADANSGNNPSVSLKNPDGFKVDVSHSEILPRDLMAIRINVDDFDAAVKELEAMGFRNPQGDRVAHSDSDDACMMFAPSGFALVISKHNK